MKIRNLLVLLEQWMPPSVAFDWDNVGLLVGSSDWETEGVVFSLDVDDCAIALAKEKNYRLIFTHHPLIFRSLKKITDPRLLDLLTNQIAVISMHTNLDVADQGVNFALAEKLGLENIQFLTDESGAKERLLRFACSQQQALQIREQIEKDIFPIKDFRFIAEQQWAECRTETGQSHKVKSLLTQWGGVSFIEEVVLENSASGWGLGACGEWNSTCSLEQFALHVKKALQCPTVQLYATEEQKEASIRSIAVCGGSGASVYRSACRMDLFITGEMGYHNVADFSTPILEVGHFFSEFPILAYLQQRLSLEFPELETVINDQPDYLKKLWTL